MFSEVINGNALHIPLPDKSVQCVVTSPPYWGLRDYGTARWDGGDPECDHIVGEIRTGKGMALLGEQYRGGGIKASTFKPLMAKHQCPHCGALRIDNQLGLESTPEEYVADMVQVFREVWRVLRDDGTLWLNLGDSYAGSGQGPNGKSGQMNHDRAMGEYSKSKRLPRGHGRWGGGNNSAPGLKPKDMVGIPWRVAFALQSDGWWLRSDIIWHKPNPMPESVTDRPTNNHEHIFLLTKSGTPQYWTHRDGYGTRSKPEPDYRWQHISGHELSEPPDDPYWARRKVACPQCGGTGVTTYSFRDDGMFAGQTFEEECDECQGKKRVKEWTKRNLWSGHDYYYDHEAIKEPCQSGPSDIKKMIEQKARIGGKNKVLIDSLAKASASTNIGRKRGVGDPSGRNKRSVWTIATRPYPGAHFATFPVSLVEPCLWAGTSAHGQCADCGAPYERLVDKTFVPQHDVSRHKGIRAHEAQKAMDASNTWGGTPRGANQIQTTGWIPTCECNGDVIPQLVIDPFAGTGTVGEVASTHRRSFLGIELSRAYIALSRERLRCIAVKML